MTVYGYLINSNYQPTEGEILWKITLNRIFFKIGIEGIDLASNTDYVIIGNAQEFNQWLATIPEPTTAIPIM